MNDKTTESQTSSVRRGEEQAIQRPDDSHGVSGIGTKSKSSGFVGSRLSGGSWEGVNPFVLVEFSNRVLDRLIWSTENRLGEARECIEWYTREVEKLEAELHQLKAIESLKSDLIKPDSLNEEE